MHFDRICHFQAEYSLVQSNRTKISVTFRAEMEIFPARHGTGTRHGTARHVPDRAVPELKISSRHAGTHFVPEQR